MRGWKPAVLVLSVALFAALVGHVVIDVLGDFMLAHDEYDDVDHSSRVVVAAVTFALAMLGAGVGLRAAIREARGSEHAFCSAVRSALPRSRLAFLFFAVVVSMLILCVMEGCDAAFSHHAVDDIGDLFGGSLLFGATIQAIVALVAAVVSLCLLGRLARARILTYAAVAFLRRCVRVLAGTQTEFDHRHSLVFRIHYACRRIAGRAPPLLTV